MFLTSYFSMSHISAICSWLTYWFFHFSHFLLDFPIVLHRNTAHSGPQKEFYVINAYVQWLVIAHETSAPGLECYSFVNQLINAKKKMSVWETSGFMDPIKWHQWSFIISTMCIAPGSLITREERRAECGRVDHRTSWKLNLNILFALRTAPL